MIKVIYNKVCGRCVQSEPLTSGMVGQPIHFEYSHDFDGLAVTAVFTDGKNTVDVVNPGNECIIPHEVLTTVGAAVKVGIYAVRGNELVIPTIYAHIGVVLKGADPSGDVSIDPTLPIWAQTQALIGNLSQIETETKDSLVAAINEVKQTADTKANAADLATVATSGSYNDLTDKPTIPSVPTATIAANTAARHTHDNKTLLDSITEALKTAWNTASEWVSANGANVLSHLSDGVRHITANERSAWNAKQDKLIAGDNITIAADGKTISATGGGGGGSTVELDTTLTQSGKAADSKAVGDALAGKQDTISDLEAIRTGAAKGATALQSVPKPLTYDYMPEGYPSKAMGTLTLMEEQELAFALENGIYSALITSAFKIVEGQTYTVNWDGTEYECIGSVFNNSMLFFGNKSIMDGGDDTGEPFCYAYLKIAAKGMFGTLDTSASHTISVKKTGEIVTPMSEEFLPSRAIEAINNAQATANAAQATANNALANFPIKYSNVVDTPFSVIEFPGEVTKYSRGSKGDGTFIDLYLSGGVPLKGSGFYKISSDVFDFEDIYKIGYKYKYSSGSSGSLISINNPEQNVIFSSNPSVFAIDSSILFCGSIGTFEIITLGREISFEVAETGIYSITNERSSTSYSFVNYIELTKKEKGFIQSSKPVLIPSSTPGSTKRFKITVDDSGTLSATEVT